MEPTDKIFIEAALENSSNLEMAIKLALCYPALIDEIVIGFLEQLEIKLRDNFPGDIWEINNRLLGPNKAVNKKRWNSIRITKKTWQGKYFIDFGFDNDNLRNLYIGISKGNNSNVSIPGFAADLSRLLAVKGSGPNENAEWWFTFDRPYKDWEGETLLLLYNDKRDETLKFYVDKLNGVKEFADPRIEAYLNGSK